MKWNEFVRDYLAFTRKERIGIIIVLLLILLVAFAPVIIPSHKNYKITKADSAWLNSMKRLEKNEDKDTKYSIDPDEDSYSHQYDHVENDNNNQNRKFFNFDPNTLDAEGWKKLGLKEKTIKTIQNYLHKGGHFSKAEDLEKIYGLKQDEFEILAPYIKIESTSVYETEKTNVQKEPSENQQSKYSIRRYTSVDINAADTSAFIALPGIGSKLAARIINFRDKLGGFYTIEQVGETFGLPDSTFQNIKQYLKLETTSIRKININTATIDELRAHPYIKWSIANPIIAYRNEHGPFLKIEDIKKIVVVTDDLYNKIAPYLVLQ